MAVKSDQRFYYTDKARIDMDQLLPISLAYSTTGLEGLRLAAILFPLFAFSFLWFPFLLRT